MNISDHNLSDEERRVACFAEYLALSSCSPVLGEATVKDFERELVSQSNSDAVAWQVLDDIDQFNLDGGRIFRSVGYLRLELPSSWGVCKNSNIASHLSEILGMPTIFQNLYHEAGRVITLLANPMDLDKGEVKNHSI